MVDEKPADYLNRPWDAQWAKWKGQGFPLTDQEQEMVKKPGFVPSDIPDGSLVPKVHPQPDHEWNKDPHAFFFTKTGMKMIDDGNESATSY